MTGMIIVGALAILFIGFLFIFGAKMDKADREKGDKE